MSSFSSDFDCMTLSMLHCGSSWCFYKILIYSLATWACYSIILQGLIKYLCCILCLYFLLKKHKIDPIRPTRLSYILHQTIAKRIRLSKAEAQLVRMQIPLVQMLPNRHNAETQILQSKVRFTSKLNKHVIYMLWLLIINKAKQKGKTTSWSEYFLHERPGWNMPNSFSKQGQMHQAIHTVNHTTHYDS